MDYDVIIRGGTVIDGTGADERTADVGVRDGRITDVGRVTGSAHREIAADGALVTPGIVDIHTHYDGQVTWDANLAPSSWHGVTTVVMGNCGVGFAPVHDDDHGRLIELMEGVEDIPGAALHEGLSWEWNSFDEFLDVAEARPHDIDFAMQVPHGALRLHVMGERGAQREDATSADIEHMARLAGEAIEAGALGFSTSRTTNHKTSRGEYTPTLTAALDELCGIAGALGEAGKGVVQVVTDFRDVEAEFDMLRAIGSSSGRPVSVSIAAGPTRPGIHHQILDQLERSNAEGISMIGQTATRAIGILLGLGGTLNPFMTNRVFRDLSGTTRAELAAQLQDPKTRQALLASSGTERDGRLVGSRLIDKFDMMFELGDIPDYEPAPTESIAARAARLGTSPAELALDIMVSGEGTGLLYVPFANYVDGSLDPVHDMLAHPFTVPGLSDGGAHVGTICDGSFPTTLLAHWGRDRAAGTFGLPYLIQRHCRDTARWVGLDDRGVIAPGYRADLNVIDFDNLAVTKPEMVWDLPAGGRRLLQRATGYLHTFVAGEETYADGEATGALPGGLVRGAQPAPASS